MPSFRIQYPKLALLVTSFVLSYMLYAHGAFDALPELFKGMGYLSVFLAGMLFSIGFTAPFGLFMLIEMAPQVHPLLAALVGGLGALIIDLIIFEAARLSLHDELKRLMAAGWFRTAIKLLYHEQFPERARTYLLWSVAGLLIASPLPDEIGVTMLSGVGSINFKRLTILCFTMDTLGILVVLSAAA